MGVVFCLGMTVGVLAGFSQKGTSPTRNPQHVGSNVDVSIGTYLCLVFVVLTPYRGNWLVSLTHSCQSRPKMPWPFW